MVVPATASGGACYVPGGLLTEINPFNRAVLEMKAADAENLTPRPRFVDDLQEAGSPFEQVSSGKPRFPAPFDRSRGCSVHGARWRPVCFLARSDPLHARRFGPCRLG